MDTNFVPNYSKYLQQGLTVEQIDRLILQVVSCKIPMSIPWLSLVLLSIKIAAVWKLMDMREKRIDKEIMIDRQKWEQSVVSSRKQEVND